MTENAQNSESEIPLVDAFVQTIAGLAQQRDRFPELINGNILIHIFDVGTWTIVTQGARAGVYADATEDPVDFGLLCSQEALATLLDDPSAAHVDALHAAGELTVHGDAGLLERLVQLCSTQTPLDIRTAGSAHQGGDDS